MPGWKGGGWLGITFLSNIHVLLTRPAMYNKSPELGFEEKKLNNCLATFKHVHRALQCSN